MLTRLTTVGAAYLSAVALLPELLISQYVVPFFLRWHEPFDRGPGEHEHDGSDPVAPDRPSVRATDPQGPPQGREALVTRSRSEVAARNGDHPQ